MKSEIHIGQLIKAKVYEIRMPITEFAQRINKSRTVAYHIFRRRSVDTELLRRISNVLGTNLFQSYTDKMDEKMLVANEEMFYGKQGRKNLLKRNSILQSENESLHKELAGLKEKFELMKKLNESLEALIKKDTR